MAYYFPIRMVATNLREYLSGIDQLIDSNQVEDALAHCRHVLKTFPKNIATYRLMGKAYLESKRHSEASDLFQRVLSSLPDDFVAHIGMSIIREDEGNLDAAIWHMERAFEAQPSNKAVQGEVRRLYGAREGYEPPKVRLTRGALARMYSHGDLYNQAIGELRNALAEDAQRPDLQVLLAEMHFKNNQPDEASAVCSQIIQKLPYCLYANRVMVDILRNAQRDVEATPYWERVEELDPYAAQVSTLKDVDEVPADSVMIDALELDSPMLLGAPAEAAQDAHEFEKEELPDWLSVDEIDTPAKQEATTPDSVMSSLEGLEPLETPSEDGGAFMDELADGTPPASTAFQTGALEPDEIPDWLRELRPGSTPPPAPAGLDPEPPGKRWTEEFKQAGFNPTGPLDLGDVTAHETPQQAQPADAPDAEAIDDESQPQATGRPTGWLPTGELRWLDTAFTGEEGGATEAGDTAAEPPAAQPAHETPDWLAELDADDLSHTQPTRPVASAFTESPAFVDTPAEPVFDDSAETTETEDSTTGESNWLGELQASSGMTDDDSELPRTDELHDEESTQRLDALAGWQSPAEDAVTPGDVAPVQATAQPVADEPGVASSTAATDGSEEEDETLNWLEGLAARRGVAEDELLTDPAQRSTAKPEWLQNEQGEPSQVTQPLSEELSWLDELAAAADPVEESIEADPAPDSVEESDRALEEDSPFSQEISDEALASEPEAEDTTPGWLRHFTGSLEEQAAAEPIAPRPLDAAPDWLSELRPQDTDSLRAAESQDDAPPQWPSAPEAVSAEANDAESGTAENQTAPAEPEDDTPDWLRQLDDAKQADWEPEAGASEDDSEDSAPAPAIEPRWVPASEVSSTPEPEAEPASEAIYEPLAVDGLPITADEDEYREGEYEAELSEDEARYEPEPERTPEPIAEAEPEPEPVPTPQAAQPEPELAEVEAAPAPAAPRKRARGLSPEEVEDRLAEARQALSYGNLGDAAEAYSYFLRRRIRLDEVIADLRAASRRFPRQVAVWQTLGDAYMRNNQLTEALDCYTRAKSLL